MIFCDLFKPAATRTVRCGAPRRGPGRKKKALSIRRFGRRDGNLWMYRAMFGEVRLPLDWPVYVSHAEATAYAKWLGHSLPSGRTISPGGLWNARWPERASLSMGRGRAERASR